MTNEVVAFSYADVAPDTVGRLKQTADAIRHSVASQVEGVVAVGKSLVEVKAALPHGMFGPWLTHEFSWTERTAVNYIHVADTFGSNPKRVSDLPLHVVYRLAAPSFPAEARERVLVAISAGEKDERQVAGLISREMMEAKQAAREAAQSPEAKAKQKVRDKARLARHARDQEKFKREIAEREAADRGRARKFWETIAEISPDAVAMIRGALKIPSRILLDELQNVSGGTTEGQVRGVEAVPV